MGLPFRSRSSFCRPILWAAPAARIMPDIIFFPIAYLFRKYFFNCIFLKVTRNHHSLYSASEQFAPKSAGLFYFFWTIRLIDKGDFSALGWDALQTTLWILHQTENEIICDRYFQLHTKQSRCLLRSMDPIWCQRLSQNFDSHNPNR